jgi:predicted transcriptional regulator of viral defense system
MVFDELLAILGQESVFESGLLLAGETNPRYIRRQLVEWVNTGKLWQLRRGLYALAPPYQKQVPHPFLIANRMVPGSYVSLQSALAYHDLIPEHAAAFTSVTTRRPGEWLNPAGRFRYRHLQPGLIFGYGLIDLGNNQSAFVAGPEKALLDLIYLTPGGDNELHLHSLRLQNLDTLDPLKLTALAGRMGKPKLQRAVTILAELAAEEQRYEAL